MILSAYTGLLNPIIWLGLWGVIAYITALIQQNPQNQPLQIEVQRYQPIQVEVQIYDLSYSAEVIHSHLLKVDKPKIKPRDIPLHERIQVATDRLIGVAIGENTKVLAPNGKPIRWRALLPGMRLRVRGVFIDRESITADEIRLVSWKIYLQRAHLRGQIAQASCVDAHLRTARGEVCLSKWPGGVRVVGVDRQQFIQSGFAVFGVGSEVEVRGWYREPCEVLVEWVRLVKRAK